MGSDRSPLVPRLVKDHPGYFKVVLSLILIHLGLAIDSLQNGPRHSPAFAFINSFLGDKLWVLAVVHTLVAVLVLIGLYWTRYFVLLRIGCAISLILFNVLAVAFAFAAYSLNLSYYAAIASVTLSLSSLAALQEPPIQAARRD